MKKWINPFVNFSSRQISCWGIAALIMTAIFSWLLPLRMISITQFELLPEKERLWMSTVEQVAIWIIFAFVLYILGAIVSESRVKFSNVAANNLFARIPFDLGVSLLAIPMVKTLVANLSQCDNYICLKGTLNVLVSVSDMLILILTCVVVIICMLWYFYWSYKAFSESTNVRNGKGIAVFVIGYVIAYLLSIYILSLM